MREKIIAANWKEHKSNSEALEYAKRIISSCGNVTNPRVIIAPGYVALSEMKNALDGSSICLAAQDIYHEDKGAFTGAVSCLMIKGICDYTLIGHSERREFFHETDFGVNLKVKAALRNGIKPIICIGESYEERQSGMYQERVKRMLTSAIEGIEDPSSLIIAYEPVWAISRGNNNVKSASPEDAQEMHLFIRTVLKEKYGDLAENISILYGGSAGPLNAKELMAKEDIDGLLVGSASLDPESFEKIIKYEG